MMIDKSLGMSLMVLFGISGIAMLMLVWLWPTLELERITATFVGSAGLFVATIQALTLKRSASKRDNEPTLIKVEVKDKL